MAAPLSATSNGVPDGALNGAASQAARFLYPHVQGFQAVWQSPAHTYRWTFDEALKRSKIDALAMRRDGFILEKLQARYLPVLSADWHVKPDEEADTDRAHGYQSLLEKTPRLLQLRKCLLEAVWFGRYGVQLAFGPVRCGGKAMTGIVDWKPINGDKIAFRYDGTPCIRINPGYANRLKEEGATVLENVGKNTPGITTAWSDQGTVLVLDQPRYRQRFVIHIHEIEDADYTEPELAGSVGGVGLRHYCYWVWWLRQEIMEWLLSYLEMMGAGGLTIVGFDASNPNGLAKAQEAFKERATIAYLPIPPGQEKQTNIVQRIEPSGTGNDIFKGWVDDYFNAILTRIIIGQNLSGQSDSTGLGSGVADLQGDVKQCIHRYDAKNLNETETQQLLGSLIAQNEPNGEVNLKCETVLRDKDPDKALDAAKKAFDMGAEIPESHVLKAAAIPEPTEGEKLLSKATVDQQEAQAQAGAAAGTDATQHGIPLDEMRRYLDAQGVPEEEQLSHLADMVDSGELQEIDTDTGVQYIEAGQSPEEPVGEPDTGKPRTYAKEDWTEETGPRGGRKWTNKKTGTVQYKEPGDGNTGPKDVKPEEQPRGDKQVGTLRKGLVTQGAYQYADKALRGEANDTLKGEGVLAHVGNIDKRMVKAQVVALASQHGMPVDSKTTKTRALAYIEDKLRSHLGKDKQATSQERKEPAEEGQGKRALGNDAASAGSEALPEVTSGKPNADGGGIPAHAQSPDAQGGPVAPGTGRGGPGKAGGTEGAAEAGEGEASPYAQKVDDLPPIPEGYGRLSHVTTKQGVDAVMRDGLDYSRQGLDATTDIHNSNDSIHHLSKTGNIAGTGFNRNKFGDHVILSDLSEEEYRKHADLTGGAPGKIHPSRIVGHIDSITGKFTANPQYDPNAKVEMQSAAPQGPASPGARRPGGGVPIQTPSASTAATSSIAGAKSQMIDGTGLRNVIQQHGGDATKAPLDGGEKKTAKPPKAESGTTAQQQRSEPGAGQTETPRATGGVETSKQQPATIRSDGDGNWSDYLNSHGATPRPAGLGRARATHRQQDKVPISRDPTGQMRKAAAEVQKIVTPDTKRKNREALSMALDAFISRMGLGSEHFPSLRG